MRLNASRLARRIGELGCVLRPHVKTHKCIEISNDIAAVGHTRGITVSTLHEANYFFGHGYDDILYAVGISSNKFPGTLDLIQRGCDLKVILDNVIVAKALAAFARACDTIIPVLIELDVDGHRAGMDPQGDDLIALARALHESEGTTLQGVMTHAGASYGCSDNDSLLVMARQERDGSLMAANRIREAGIPCPVVSIGSTPTAFAIDDLSGITEVRAGVYALFDLVMTNVGVCSLNDIAASVLVTVTGHQQNKGWLITDGGWMALSRDRGTARQAKDYGYGAVTDSDGNVIANVIMIDANQEHGVVARTDGQPIDFDAHPIGSQLRILPNHACATVSQHRAFNVLEHGCVNAHWDITGGW
ncbi:alanine racemase [Congregibacter sp.]|uniref:alanine racemase n=1 Tax=Congregibacter sp. TaxID=2744308 RepID=UPI003F6C26B4